MSLRFKPLNTDDEYTTPVMNIDHSYTVFSGENITIPAGETIKVSSRLLVSLPNGYFPFVYGSELESSRNISTSMCNSINFSQDVDTTDTENNMIAKELAFILTNNGERACQINIGDPIARMILLLTGTFPLEKVDTFVKPVVKPEVPQASYKTHKTFQTWFKLKYIANLESITSVMNESEKVALVEFKNSEQYTNARNKDIVVVNHILRKLNVGTKKVLREIFTQEKLGMDVENPTNTQAVVQPVPIFVEENRDSDDENDDETTTVFDSANIPLNFRPIIPRIPILTEEDWDDEDDQIDVEDD